MVHVIVGPTYLIVSAFVCLAKHKAGISKYGTEYTVSFAARASDSSVVEQAWYIYVRNLWLVRFVINLSVSECLRPCCYCRFRFNSL